MKRRGLTAWVVGALVAGSVGGLLRADVMVKNDGTRMQGRVVAEDAQTVTFETNFEGLIVRQKFARGEIKSVTHEALPTGVGYAVLPMAGEVGKEITADSLSAALQMARGAKAKYVILDFDSPGGSLWEMYKLLKMMSGTKDVTLVAYVENEAISAASILAVACPNIYMKKGSAIGATVPFKLDAKGLPQDVEQKFLSADRALFRAAAEAGGHSALFVRGMSEMEVELGFRKEEGKPVVFEVPSSGLKVGEELIKAKGKILTMTASEAERYGLSAGTVNGVDDIRRMLGVDAWANVGQSATAYLTNRSRAIHLAGEGSSAGNDTLDVKHKAEEMVAKVEELRKKRDDLKGAYEKEVAAVQGDYDKALSVQRAPAEFEKVRTQAEQDATKKLEEIKVKYGGEMMLIDGELKAIQQEAERMGKVLKGQN